MQESRIQNLRASLAQKGLEAALVLKRENYIYLSGFTGTSAFLLITQMKALLITDFRYAEQAASQAECYEIIEYQGSATGKIKQLLEDYNIRTLGFEENYLTVESYMKFKEVFGLDRLEPLNGSIEKLRLCKDKGELEVIKKAVAIADLAFVNTLQFLKPGIREIEVAAELEYQMRKEGAKGPSFETIVASGVRASLPHGVASEKKLCAGEVVTLDFGAVYQDYCSDMTRTVFLGQPRHELEKIYGIVRKAQEMAAKGAVKGRAGVDVDRIARDFIYSSGYEGRFGHGLGHGVGLEIHEEPRLSLTGDMVLENGMVVTVEPGIYIPRLGGVRIEDMVVIEDHSPVVLTSSTKDIIIL